MVIRNSSNGVFLGCSGYDNEGDDKCKKTVNLISGDEAISVDDNQEKAYSIFLKVLGPDHPQTQQAKSQQAKSKCLWVIRS